MDDYHQCYYKHLCLRSSNDQSISEFGQQAVNTVSCRVHPTLAGRYCGSYMDHQTIFRVPSPLVHIQLQCSSRLSDKPLLVEYGSYNISQRKMEISALRNRDKRLNRGQHFVTLNFENLRDENCFLTSAID